ncbi:MAG: hypothetical protein CBC25_00110 [Pelagibacteraceae bacterium TMED65]|nr:MAG: hypothetical protein CBC25_00110 [Pelagibacteraceae bacterium TMED65]
MIKKVNTYLNLRQKFLLSAVLISYFLISFLEVLSIGTIPVLISYILKPSIFLDRIENIDLKIFLTEYFENYTQNELLLRGCVIIFFLFLFKNIFTFLVNFLEGITNRNIKYSINHKLFTFYLYSNYNFHLNTNPSIVLRNINASSTAANSITSLMMASREVIIIFGLICLLIYSGFLTTLSLLFIIFLVMACGFLLINRILIKKSKESANFQSSQIKTINQFIGSIVDIKIKGKEKFFSNLYSDNIFKYETINLFMKIIKSIPKLLIEILAISGLLIIIVVYSINYNDLSEIVPFLALITLSLLRILPSTMGAVNALTDLRFQKVYFDLIYKDLVSLKKMNIKNPNKYVNKEYEFRDNIILKNIKFNYKDLNSKFIENINFEIHKGKKIGIVGKSGSGKSTLLNIILGLLKPQNGTIQINHDNVKLDENSRIVWKNLSYIPQDIYLLDDTILRNIAFGVSDKNIDIERVKKIVKICEIDKFLNKQKEGLNTFIGNRGIRISGGQKQRVGFARALYNNPNILFLDEATSNLDSETEQKIIENILKSFKEITIISITHKLINLKNFDEIVLLENGKILHKGSYQEILEKYET